MEEKTDKKFFYKRLVRHYLGDEARKNNFEAVLTAAAYHKSTKILVTGELTKICQGYNRSSMVTRNCHFFNCYSGI